MEQAAQKAEGTPDCQPKASPPRKSHARLRLPHDFRSPLFERLIIKMRRERSERRMKIIKSEKGGGRDRGSEAPLRAIIFAHMNETPGPRLPFGAPEKPSPHLASHQLQNGISKPNLRKPKNGDEEGFCPLKSCLASCKSHIYARVPRVRICTHDFASPT